MVISYAVVRNSSAVLICIPQAASLPRPDQKIENITVELVQRAVSVSRQLAFATEVKKVSLLPMDLKSTNYIIAQVQ